MKSLKKRVAEESDTKDIMQTPNTHIKTEPVVEGELKSQACDVIEIRHNGNPFPKEQAFDEISIKEETIV